MNLLRQQYVSYTVNRGLSEESEQWKHRIKRTYSLLGSFIANLAYYEAAYQDDIKVVLDSSNFLRAVTGNCYDISILEWCKLFADKDADHYWQKITRKMPGNPKDKFFKDIVKFIEEIGENKEQWENLIGSLPDEKEFFKDMLNFVAISEDKFIGYKQGILTYRDQSIAHLDRKLNTTLPIMDWALKAARFYYEYLIKFYPFLFKPSKTFGEDYQDRFLEAQKIYKQWNKLT